MYFLYPLSIIVRLYLRRMNNNLLSTIFQGEGQVHTFCFVIEFFLAVKRMFFFVKEKIHVFENIPVVHFSFFTTIPQIIYSYQSCAQYYFRQTYIFKLLGQGYASFTCEEIKYKIIIFYPLLPYLIHQVVFFLSNSILEFVCSHKTL